MSDIFISYATVDRERIQPIVKILEKEGWSVWWDRKIPPGRTFDDVIEEAIDAAKCVIVVWSEKSVKSDWVRTEAAEGKRKGTLIPVLIDNVNIPLAFRRIEAAQLKEWDGVSNHPEVDILLSSIANAIGNRSTADEIALERKRRQRTLKTREKNVDIPDISGQWQGVFKYSSDANETFWDVHIKQDGRVISGTLIASNVYSKKMSVVQQEITGEMTGEKIMFHGISYIFIRRGEYDYWSLDSFSGMVSKDLNSIKGVANDESESSGKFTLKRITKSIE